MPSDMLHSEELYVDGTASGLRFSCHYLPFEMLSMFVNRSSFTPGLLNLTSLDLVHSAYKRQENIDCFESTGQVTARKVFESWLSLDFDICSRACHRDVDLHTSAKLLSSRNNCVKTFGGPH